MPSAVSIIPPPIANIARPRAASPGATTSKPSPSTTISPKAIAKIFKPSLTSSNLRPERSLIVGIRYSCIANDIKAKAPAPPN